MHFGIYLSSTKIADGVHIHMRRTHTHTERDLTTAKHHSKQNKARKKNCSRFFTAAAEANCCYCCCCTVFFVSMERAWKHRMSVCKRKNKSVRKMLTDTNKRWCEIFFVVVVRRYDYIVFVCVFVISLTIFSPMMF